MQGLSKIVARRRQETGLGEVGDFKLTRALLDLALERGIRVLEPGCHAVELIPERLQLIAGLDGNALGQIAAADACSAVAQRSYRHNHSTGQEQAGKKCKREPREEQEPGADHRVVKR